MVDTIRSCSSVGRQLGRLVGVWVWVGGLGVDRAGALLWASLGLTQSLVPRGNSLGIRRRLPRKSATACNRTLLLLIIISIIYLLLFVIIYHYSLSLYYLYNNV